MFENLVWRLKHFGGLSRREKRAAMAAGVERELGPFDPAHLRALAEVPRERFVRPGDLARAEDDTPLSLDEAGLATVSAPHAYLLSFRLLGLAHGDKLIELGSGSGYGAALASEIVGSKGWVKTFEIDPTLAEWAKETLRDRPNVEVTLGDAMSSAPHWGDANRVVCTFALAEIPPAWLGSLHEGVVLVAPVGARERDQHLVRVTREAGEIVATEHGAVRYVRNRSSAV
jgi:protein-L-isoaspartate(D-aspartate) O-methyltransferase